MKFRRSLLWCLPLCGSLVGCQAPDENESLIASSEAVAVFTDVQQRFAVAHVDYRSRNDPRPMRAQPTRRVAVLAPQRDVDLRVLGGRVVRNEASRFVVSSGLTAQERVEITDLASGAAVGVKLLHATAARAELVDGYLVYRGGHGSGADVVHQLGRARHEDFVIFRAPPVDTTVRYQLELGQKIAGLRMIDSVVELLDQDGVPRLRMNRPYTVDAAGERKLATVAIEGCQYDQNPQAPFYRDVTAPGASACTLAVAWDGAAAAYPVLLDPVWTAATSMVSPREGHGMSLLTTGDVLAAGGSDGTDIIATAEVYSVSANAWAATASLPDGARYGGKVVTPGATVTTLGAPIFIGGYRGFDTPVNVTAVERYEVGTGTWTTLTPSLVGRNGHTATVYATGSGSVQIMVTGGYNTTSQILSSGERGTGAGSWTATTYGGATLRRTNHTVTRLQSGRLLMAGGYGGGSSDQYLSTCRLFNNSLNSWGSTATLGAARKDHTATLMPDGRVLVAGGVGAGDAVLDTAEIYTPSPAGWAPTVNPMSFQRAGHAAVALTDGTVLLAGGSDATGAVLDSAEVFDPTVDDFFLFGDTAFSPRVFHDMTLLNDGRVLLCGGLTTFTSGTPTATCEMYDATAD